MFMKVSNFWERISPWLGYLSLAFIWLVFRQNQTHLSAYYGISEDLCFWIAAVIGANLVGTFTYLSQLRQQIETQGGTAHHVDDEDTRSNLH